MADKNFKVRHGLDVSGDASITGNVQVSGNNIKASDGNNNITLTSNTLTTFAGDIKITGNDIQNSAGNALISMPAIGNTVTFAGDIRVNGNDILASDGLINTTLTSNTLTAFAGDIRVNGNDIQASDGLNNITMTSNTLTAFAGDIKVSGNDIQDSTNTNAVSLMPNGVRSQRFVRGAIRDATADGNGDIGRLGNLAYSGVSLSNDTTYDTTYNAFWLRNYSGSSLADPRTLMLMEGARGTSASPLAINTNNTIFRLIGSGFVGSGTWATDSTATGGGTSYPFELRAIATEAWGTNAWGTKFQVRAQPSGTTPTGTPITLIDHDPGPSATSTYRSNAWSFQTPSDVVQLTLNAAGNMVLTGSLRINGDELKNSTGNTAISFATGANPIITFPSDIRINGGDILNSTGDTTITMFSGANANTVFAGNIKVNGDNIKASDGSDNITLTSSTLTTFAGDIKINGLDIQNNTGNNAIRMATGANPNVTFTGDIVIEGGDIRNPAGNTAMTMTSANTNVAFANDIQIIGDGILDGNNEYRLAFDFGPESAARIIKNNNGSFFTCEYFEADSASDTAQFETYVQPSTGATLNNWSIGLFKFHGYDNNNFEVGASMEVKAAETWSISARGAEFDLGLTIIGTTNAYQALQLRSDGSTLRSDQFDFEDTALNPLPGSAINYSRQYGDFANLNTITPAAANTAYAIALPTTNSSNGISIASTSQITCSDVGKFNLQFSVQWENTDNGNDHNLFIWIRKNGTDISNSAGRITCVKNNEGIAAWNYIVEATTAGDYFELMYSVDDTSIQLPYIAASSPVPAIPSVILTMVPVGI